jgi:hypothetical protein
MNASNALWLCFGAFAVGAVCWKSPTAPTSPQLVAFGIWGALVAFTAYSAYCSSQENLFSSIREMGKLHWGRQVGLDLYIGLSLTVFLVYLNERSILVALIWLVPFFLFGNLATLLYWALSYNEIVGKLFR